MVEVIDKFEVGGGREIMALMIVWRGTESIEWAFLRWVKELECCLIDKGAGRVLALVGSTVDWASVAFCALF
jgi:hypothetical protein